MMTASNFTLQLSTIDEEGPSKMTSQQAVLYPVAKMGSKQALGADKRDSVLINYSTLMDLLLRHRRNSLALVGALVISMCICNSSSVSRKYATSLRSEQRLFSNFQSGHFAMCERSTPLYKFVEVPTFQASSPRRSKLLLLKDSSTALGSNNFGNQMNALLHAFDYARYNNMDLGITMESWAMKAIHQLFMQDFFSSIVNGKKVTATTAAELLKIELGVKIITDEKQLKSFDVVETGSFQDLLNYQPPSFYQDWKQIKDNHVYILQRLFRHYNSGNGFDINMNESEEMNLTRQACSSLHSLFGDEKSVTPYVVIHAKEADLGAGDVAPIGSLVTSQYMNSVLKDLGMSEYPIVLLSDESTASQMIEEELKMNPTIAKNLKIIYSRGDLNGPDAMVGVLSSVYIGSPGSATSGFIARSRYALGYRGSTFMFNRDTLSKWRHECEDDCVFHPGIMQKLI